jgi:hypothetical protein
MLLDHEIDYIAGRLFLKFADRLEGSLRAMEKEIKRMTDQAVTDITEAVDDVLTELNLVVTTLEADAAALAAALANSASANDPALEALAGRLKAGSAAAKTVLSTLVPASPAVAPSPAAEPAPVSGATA